MAWNDVPPATFREDGYMNMLTRYGTSQDSSTAWKYRGDGMVPDMTLTEQYETNGLFTRIIDIPAEEAIKHGFDLGLGDTDTETYIKDMLDWLDWEEKAATALKWTRLYGGALGVLLIDDGRGIDEPVNWQRVRGIEEIRIYERACVWPDYSVMYDFNNIPKPTRKQSGMAPTRYGMPEFYYVNSIFGQFWVHESRCLVFRNGILPERTLQANYRFWGVPEYVRIRNQLRETATSHSMSVKMLEKSVQAVYKMKGLAKILARDFGEEELIKRLQAIDLCKSFLSSIAIDAEGEDYSFQEFSMTGVKEVINSTYNMLSAVTTIPQTVLFGRSPEGMNATGKSDLENWYNYIERIQKLNLRRNLQTVLDVIVRAGIASGKLTEEPEYKLKFNPLWSMSEEEEIKAKHTKAQIRQVNAQAARTYFDMGVLAPSEIRKGLAQEGDFCVEDLLESIGASTDIPDMWLGEGVVGYSRTDSDLDPDGWVTINNAKVNIGDDGEIKAGMGGKYTGQKISEIGKSKPSSKVSSGVTGKNLAEHDFSGRLQSGDSITTAVIKEQGFDGLPNTLPPSDFEEFIRENDLQVMYRGISAETPEQLEHYTNELLNGEFYIDQRGASGAGMYAAGSERAVRMYAIGNNSRVFEMAFHPSANLISYDELFATARRNNVPETFNNQGAMAAVLGYDAIVVAQNEIVILNRTKLVIKN